MKALHITAFILVVVGALNVGLTALGYNVINMLLGSWPTAESTVYILVGVAALYKIFSHRKHCKECVAATM